MAAVGQASAWVLEGEHADVLLGCQQAGGLALLLAVTADGEDKQGEREEGFDEHCLVELDGLLLEGFVAFLDEEVELEGEVQDDADAEGDDGEIGHGATVSDNEGFCDCDTHTCSIGRGTALGGLSDA